MAITADQIQAWLQMLRAEGVEEFECEGFSVRFGTMPQRADAVVPVPRHDSAVKKATSIWEDEHLWPTGAPPKFPGSE